MFNSGWYQTRLYPQIEFNDEGKLRGRTMKNELKPKLVEGEWYIVYKGEFISINRLLADTVLGDRRGRNVVHKDNDPTNFAPSNLAYAGWPQKGEKNGRAKITQQIADNIREAYKREGNVSALSRQFGISRPEIYKILDGKVWNG